MAIELAAARVRVMPPETIVSELDHQLALLTGGPRDAPERQRTLGGTIAWSYDLLDEPERRLLGRLAVFAGGCSVEAAEFVCAGEDTGDVLEGISSLVEKSLLRGESVVGGQSRFSMLQTLREFALERLEDGGHADAVRRLHAEYFTAMAEEAGPAMLTRDRDVWLERVSADYDNLRTAMRFSLDAGEPGRVALVGGGLCPFWREHGRILEGVSWMALLQEASMSPEERAVARMVVGALAFSWGDYEKAAPTLARAENLCRDVANRFGTAFSLALTGVIVAVRDDPVKGEEVLTRALEEFGRIGHIWGMGFARFALGRALLLQERGNEARQVLERSVVDARQVGEKQLLTLALLNLGEDQCRRPERGQGVTSRVSRSRGGIPHNSIDAARVLEALAAVAVAVSDPVRGALLFGAAEGVRRSAGARVWAPDRPGHMRTQEALRAALGPEAFAATFAEGTELSLEAFMEVAAAL